ncbi:MAG TPA: hypothetical protein VIM34_16155 [Burkholderiaceae bacterium]
MSKKLLVMSALMAAGLQLGCAHKLPRSDGAALAKPDMPPCLTNADCRIAVYVSIGAAQECHVQLLFGKVTVAPVKRPKVVWRIEKADPDGDDFDYRFKFDPTADPAVYGIDIVGNDPTQDFDQPDYDNGNNRKFKWKSKHDRRMGFDYKVNVERRSLPHGRWSDCKLLDPRIVND